MLKQTPHKSIIASGIIFLSVILQSYSALALQKPSQAPEITETVSILSLQNIALRIDKRIANMKILANTIANDTHIHQWVEDGHPEVQEKILLEKLAYVVGEYELTSASFADTQSNKYWNHEGFLRVLDPKIDTWYFNYLASNRQDLISVYHDKNKHRVDLYVNYRQANGLGLSGIATSFDGVVNMLSNSELSQFGELFIVDSLGKIQVHSDPDIAGSRSLQAEFDSRIATVLLRKQATNEVQHEQDEDVYLASALIPSMNWFVVFQRKISHVKLQQ
jgi:methyl-accepting chemotaxis protein